LKASIGEWFRGTVIRISNPGVQVEFNHDGIPCRKFVPWGSSHMRTSAEKPDTGYVTVVGSSAKMSECRTSRSIGPDSALQYKAVTMCALPELDALNEPRTFDALPMLSTSCFRSGMAWEQRAMTHACLPELERDGQVSASDALPTQTDLSLGADKDCQLKALTCSRLPEIISRDEFSTCDTLPAGCSVAWQREVSTSASLLELDDADELTSESVRFDSECSCAAPVGEVDSEANLQKSIGKSLADAGLTGLVERGVPERYAVTNVWSNVTGRQIEAVVTDVDDAYVKVAYFLKGKCFTQVISRTTASAS